MTRLYKESRKRARDKYNRSYRGLIVRMYLGMRNRTKGKCCKSPELYNGKTLCDRDAFIAFAMTDEVYAMLYRNWKHSGFNKLRTPSVNRKDNSKGYELDNIEFITFQENCALAHIGRTNYKGRYSNVLKA